MVIVMDSSQGQLLPHDSSGFLVGERLVKGVDLVGKDTAEILKILRASFGLQIISNNRLRVTLDRINNKLSSRTIDVTPTPSPVPRLGNGSGNSGNANPLPTVDTGAPSDNNRPIPPTREYGDPAPDNGSNGSGNPAPTPSPTIDPPMPQNGDIEPPTPEGDGSGGLINGIKNAVRDGLSMGNADTQNIDPTVDAVRELGDLMSPLAKVGKTMFKGAAWLFRRKKKREEPSDQEQRQQSRIEKLLQRIAGSRVGQAAGSGFNLFGGLFSSLAGTAGGLLSGLGKILIPALGLGTAFSLGKFVGNKIYDYIEPALTPLIDGVAAIPDKMSKAWDGVIEIASNGIEAVVNTVTSAKNAVTGAYDAAVNATSNGIENVVTGAQGFFNWGNGIYQGAINKTSQGMESIANKFKGKASSNFTDNKSAAIKATADRLGVSPNDLAQIISFESAGSFDPAKKNMGGGNATGLIQFTQGTAKQMGTTTEDLAKMSFEQQMAYVEKYFVDRGIGKNGKTSIADMYNAVQGVPKSGYKAGTKAYDQNKAWDVNKDGVIMPNEAVTGKGFMAHAKDYYPVASAATTKVVAPASPMSVPKLLARPMPEVPKQKQQVSTKEQKPMQVSVVGGNESISQNLSDRHLAHAVTGGLGMDALRHG